MNLCVECRHHEHRKAMYTGGLGGFVVTVREYFCMHPTHKKRSAVTGETWEQRCREINQGNCAEFDPPLISGRTDGDGTESG